VNGFSSRERVPDCTPNGRAAHRLRRTSVAIHREPRPLFRASRRRARQQRKSAYVRRNSTCRHVPKRLLDSSTRFSRASANSGKRQDREKEYVGSKHRATPPYGRRCRFRRRSRPRLSCRSNFPAGELTTGGHRPGPRGAVFGESIRRRGLTNGKRKVVPLTQLPCTTDLGHGHPVRARFLVDHQRWGGRNIKALAQPTKHKVGVYTFSIGRPGQPVFCPRSRERAVPTSDVPANGTRDEDGSHSPDETAGVSKIARGFVSLDVWSNFQRPGQLKAPFRRSSSCPSTLHDRPELHAALFA